MDRDQRGYVTTKSLFAIPVLNELPGRKTVSSRGPARRWRCAPRLRSVVSRQPLEHLSGYRRLPGCARSAARPIRAPRDRVGQGACASCSSDRSAKLPSADDPDQKAETMRLTRRAASPSSPRTPAYFCARHNDLRKAFERIDEDQRFHYLLTYRQRTRSSTGHSATSRSRPPGRTRFCPEGWGAALRAHAACPDYRRRPWRRSTPRSSNGFPFDTAAITFRAERRACRRCWCAQDRRPHPAAGRRQRPNTLSTVVVRVRDGESCVLR